MNPEHVHQLAGALVLIFTLLLLAKEAGIIHARWAAYVLPAGVVLVGLFLFLDPIVFHGGDFGGEGLQHQVQGALAIAVGIIEALRVRGKVTHRAYGAVLPVAIIILGLLFVLHSQHGGGDMATQLAQHRMLGSTVILAGLVKGADNLKLARGNWAALGWLLLLLVVCFDLFFYSEGGGAMPSHGGH